MDRARVDLSRRVGDMSQLAGARLFRFEGGIADGTRAVELHNAAGLRLTLLADQCLDILELSYKGTNLAFRSKNGAPANSSFDPHDEEFLYYWRAGMLYTCGLANTGPSCRDAGLHRTEHGRIGMSPAENLRISQGWEGEDYLVRVEGEMSESVLCGSRLRLTRRVELSLFSKEVRVLDRLENLEPLAEEFMLLYHVNFGYPLLDSSSRMVTAERGVEARTPDAVPGLGRRSTFSEPVDGSGEECFFYDCAADATGRSHAALLNRDLGLGAYVGFDRAKLPVLTQWKNPRAHDYAMGIEPGNSYIMGRAKEREHGSLASIPGYSSIDYDLRLGVLEGQGAMDEFEARMAALSSSRV